MKPKSLLQRVLQFAREELERRARNEGESARDSRYDSAPPHPQHARDEGYPGASSVRETALQNEASLHGLEVVRAHEAGLLTLRWAIGPSDVSRAEALLSGSPVLCLRLVSFSKQRDDVLREVQDRPGIELSGQVEIVEPAQRAVVSLGLRAGERFVSIAHHVL